MPTTSRGYRYPILGDTGDVPLWMQRLAVDLNTDVGTVAARTATLEATRALPWEPGNLTWGNGNSNASPASWSRLQRSGPGLRTWTYQARLVAAAGGGIGRWYLQGLPGPANAATTILAGGLAGGNVNDAYVPIFINWGRNAEGLWFVYGANGWGNTAPSSAGAIDTSFAAGLSLNLNFTMEANV